MKTENLVNLVRIAESNSADWELFNEVRDITFKESVFLNWCTKHTIEFEENDKDVPLFGSYLISYQKNHSNAVEFHNMMNNLLDKEDYTYVSWYGKNLARNTEYPYWVITQIGCFLEENI